MAFNLPPTLTDALSAVNVMLSSIGESPVTTIEGDVSEATEAAGALVILNEQLLAVQSEGWPWNRDYQVHLAPDNTGRCPLPENALRITKAYPGEHSGSLVERGRFLYDNRQQSYVFPSGAIVDLISKLAFDEMPEAARRYVTITAAQQFQGRVQTNATVDRVLDSQVMKALRTLEEERDEAEPANVITGNVETLYRTHGRNLRRRY